MYMNRAIPLLVSFRPRFLIILAVGVPPVMKKHGFGEIKTEDDFYSYLYLSLITQTTVGYGGVLPDGGQMITTKSVLLKYLVIIQLFSVIIMTGWTLA